ncbi:MAG: site-2 protease family protein [Chloroflexi bacterium]|nr:site-2 protease family protein [Chloroflexota bacterium]
MNGTLHLGRIAGISIELHYSWFFVFVLLTLSLAVGFFPVNFPTLGPTATWVASAASAILLFVAVLLHELSHSFVARARGMEVQSITLFIFGGMSNIRGEPRSALDEFLMAVAGPLASFALGAVCFGLTRLGLPTPALAVLSYLALVNVLLGVFNLIPGFPLDGGRVLRSILWGTTHNLRRATLWAAGVGQGVAWLFILGGFYIAFFEGALLSGIWLALIGFFLNSAAEASRAQASVRERFRGVRVADLMSPRPVVVGPDLPLEDLVERFVLERNLRALPVVEDDRLMGIITLVDVRHIPRDRWPYVAVGQVMTPAERLKVVEPDDPLALAVALLGQDDFHQVPVVRSGRLVGLLTRSQIIRFLQVRDELGLEGAEEQVEARRAA